MIKFFYIYIDFLKYIDIPAPQWYTGFARNVC